MWVETTAGDGWPQYRVTMRWIDQSVLFEGKRRSAQYGLSRRDGDDVPEWLRDQRAEI